MNGFRAVIAVFVLVAFTAFCVFLILNAGTDTASEWERWIYVFGAAEAIAFAGLGWVFGREINRERAESAEGSAEEANQEAKKEAAKGATLAGLVFGGTAPPEKRTDLQVQGVSGAPHEGEADPLAAARDFAQKHYGL